MKTLDSPINKEGIITRLQSVRPSSECLWGRIPAHQMICSLGDAFQVALGEKAISAADTLFGRTIYKWVILWNPVQWPRDIKTPSAQ